MTVTPEDPRVRTIGTVHSRLVERDDAPRQADEGAPASRIVIDPAYREACEGILVGDHVVVLTWLHLADRAVIRTRPRDEPGRAVVGVFATRSPDRPNSIGLHTVTVIDIDDTTITVDALEAVNGTPVIDIKPVLGATASR